MRQASTRGKEANESGFCCCCCCCCLMLFLYTSLYFLTGKTCPLYPPPKRGALVCSLIGDDRNCQVQCNENFDFAFNPPFSYFCSRGKWDFFSVYPYDRRLPWPDCSSKLWNCASNYNFVAKLLIKLVL